MQAAVGLVQLDKLSDFIRKRKENFAYLKDRLAVNCSFRRIFDFAI